MGENFVALGREFGDAFYDYQHARNHGTVEAIDEAAEHLYRTWVSLPIDPDAEWTEAELTEARESQRVQAPTKDGQT